eukprot:gene13894-16392_t
MTTVSSVVGFQSFVPRTLLSTDTNIAFDLPYNISNGDWTITIDSGSQVAYGIINITPNVTDLSLTQISKERVTCQINVTLPESNSTISDRKEDSSEKLKRDGIIAAIAISGIVLCGAIVSIIVWVILRCIHLQYQKLPVGFLGYKYPVYKWRGFPTWREFISNSVAVNCLGYPIKDPTDNIQTIDLCIHMSLGALIGENSEAYVESILAYSETKDAKETTSTMYRILAPLGYFNRILGKIERNNMIGSGVHGDVSTVLVNGVNCVAKLVKLLTGIKELRKIGIYHRDLHPGNILLHSVDSGNLEFKFKDIILKIGDLGESRVVGESATLTPIHGSAHAAPEILSGDYNESVDIYSAGIIAFVMIARCYPFVNSGVDFNGSFQVLRRGRVPQFPANGLPLASIITDMINLDPSQRPLIDNAIERFQNAQEVMVTVDYMAQTRANPIENLVEGVDYNYKSNYNIIRNEDMTSTNDMGLPPASNNNNNINNNNNTNNDNQDTPTATSSHG